MGFKLFCLLHFTLNLFSAPMVQSYQTHTALGGIVFTNMDATQGDVHNEYYFGKCATPDKELVARFYYKYEDLKGKLLIGDWLSVSSEPDCVYIKSTSPYDENVKYDSQKFTICICRVSYYYLINQFFDYYYFEWYIPLELTKELNWEIDFYDVL